MAARASGSWWAAGRLRDRWSGLLGVAPRALGGSGVRRRVHPGRRASCGPAYSRCAPRSGAPTIRAQRSGRYTGRIVIVSSLAVAAAAALAGLDAGQAAHRLALVVRRRRGGRPARRRGCIARARVRREFALLRRRERGGRAAPSRSASACCSRSCARIRISANTCSGWESTAAATSCSTSQLVVIFSEHLHLSPGLQIALLSVVPLGMLPLFVPFWARMFDRGHIVEYRARQGWSLVLAVTTLTLGTCAGVGADAVARRGAAGRSRTPAPTSAGISGTMTSLRSAARSTTWACTSRSPACAARSDRPPGY